MKYLLLFILSIICATSFAQKHKHKRASIYKEPSPKDVLLFEIEDECFFSNKYSKTQRLHFYPFSKAASIRLISFKEGQRIPVNNKIIDTARVLQQVVLTNNQTDSLTNLLYNIGFTPISEITSLADPGFSCYEPRNGILFVDAAGKAFEYIEICFACERTEKSSISIKEGQYCSTKFDLLRNFFRASGVKYGTEERSPTLNYNQIFSLDTTDFISAIKTKLIAKTDNDKDISKLNQTEQTLLLAINANQIYHHYSLLDGLAQFYFAPSGNYFDQTIKELRNIGAYLTIYALKSSKAQWPENAIPTSILKRRDVLLKIINRSNPKWRKLEKGLFNLHEDGNDQYLVPKEDIDGLIFKFANLHRSELND